jgi:diguanylate cyclase (GGDEF)-like protein
MGALSDGVSALTFVTLPVISGLAVALLGLSFRRVRATRAANQRLDGEALRRERALLAIVQSLLQASRASSAAVLETLGAAVRQLDDGIDCLLVFAPNGEELACVHAGGSRAEHFARHALRRDDASAIPAKAAQRGCRMLAPFDGGSLIPTDRFAIAVPMIDSRALLAVAYASSASARDPRDADAIVRALECAAAPYAIALERESDRTEATHDGLTGLLAARAFRRRLHEDVARGSRAERRPVLCLWFVDTDRFKTVNDRFGHRAGDGVLQAMASLLRAHLAPDLDVAARNGGDEFCALLRGTSKGAAIERAQAFCNAVREHDFGLPVRITASVGVAAFPHDAPSSSALLEAADAAMYRSKRDGRDRVSFAAEAEAGFSRNSPQWRSNVDESRARRSSHSCFS